MKRLIPFILIFVCSQAEAKIFIKPFDQTGVTVVTESDGSPSTTPRTIKFANGNVTDNGDGSVTIADQTGAGGATFTVKEDDTNISTTVGTLDLGLGLDGTQAPAGEINVSLDATEYRANATTGGFMQAQSIVSIDVLLAASHDPVTLAGFNYLTLAGQQITAGDVALGTQTSGNYAAGDAEAGNALTGDSATLFFSAGQIEAARGGTGDDTSATTGMPRITAGNWTYDADFRHLASVDVVGVPRGGTGRGVISNDAVLVGNNGGDGFDAPPLPNCVDSGGNHLNYTAATGSFSCGTTGDGTGSGGGGFMIRASEDGTFVADNGNRQMNLNFTTGIKATSPTSNDIVTVSGDMATTTTPGIASFDSTQFSVAAFGGVTHKASADALYIGTGSGVDMPAVPDCNGTGKALSYTAATNNFTCNTISVSGSASKYVGIFMPPQAKLPLVNPAQIDAGKPGWRLLFDATTGERVSFDTVMTPYQGGAVSAEVVWTATSGTSGGVSWALSFDCITSGDNVAVDLGSFATPNWIVGAAPGTAGFEAFARGSLANFDSCADKDRMRLMVSRDTVSADDTMTGDAELRSVLIYEV